MPPSNTSRFAAALLLVVSTAIATGIATPAIGQIDDSSQARNQVISVNGYAAGRENLGVWADQCVEDTTEEAVPEWAFDLQPMSNAPRGARVHGWIPEGPGWEQGVNAPITRPTDSTVFQMEVYSPTGRISGHAVAAYYPPDGTVWVGQAAIDRDTGTGWYLLDASRPNFVWTQYRDGDYVGDGGTAQLAAFAESHGGDGDGARLGFTLGCDGDPFYFDNLVVGPAGESRIYDFEGYRTRLQVTPEDKCSLSMTKLPMRQSVSGSLAWQSRTGKWFGLSGRVDIKAKGASFPLDRATTGAKGAWKSVFTVKRPVKVVARFDGDADDNPTQSAAELVRSYPKIEFNKGGDRSVRVGQKLIVSGRIAPAARHRFTTLLTHYDRRKGWDQMRSQGAGRTDSKGRFRIQVTARRVGLQTIDILTSNSKVASSAISRYSVLFNVSPKPKPQPQPTGSGGYDGAPTGGDSGGDSGGGTPPDVIEDGSDDNGTVDPGDEFERPSTRPKGFGACGWYKYGKPAGARLERSAPPTRASVLPIVPFAAEQMVTSPTARPE